MSKGTTTIRRSDLRFLPVREECRKNFIDKRKDVHGYSEFEIEMTMRAGNAIRGSKSQHFWSEGKYCWFTDGTQSKIQCVWLTDNGNLLFEDESKNELCLITFK